MYLGLHDIPMSVISRFDLRIQTEQRKASQTLQESRKLMTSSLSNIHYEILYGIHIVTGVLVILPISVASGEQSFSKLKLIKLHEVNNAARLSWTSYPLSMTW